MKYSKTELFKAFLEGIFSPYTIAMYIGFAIIYFAHIQSIGWQIVLCGVVPLLVNTIDLHFQKVENCLSLFQWNLRKATDETRTIKSLEFFPFGIQLVCREIKGKLQDRVYWNFFVLSVSRHFSFGMQHIYYDGPHHSFSLGFLHLYWQPRNWCQKCYDGA